MSTSQLLLVFFNIVWYGIYAAALCFVLDRRYGWVATLLVFAVCFTCSVTYGLIYEFSTKNNERAATMLRLVIGLGEYFIPAVVLFRDKWYKGIFVSGVCFAIQLVADTLSTSLFIPQELLQNGSMTDVPVLLHTFCMVVTTGIILFLTWIFVLLMRSRRNRLAPEEWILFFVFPISQIVLLGGWQFVPLSDRNTDRTLVMLVGMILTVAADGFLFFAVRGMAQRRQLAADKSVLEQQIELQKKHYAALTEQYEDLRRMRHDIANHLETMKALLENGAYDEASRYTHGATEWFSRRSRLGTCENPVAEAFLMAKQEELRRQGCTAELQVSIPLEMGIANADLIAAFGNLLDNAAEACAQSPDRHFTLAASVSHGFLTIRTDNAVPQRQAPRRRRIRELPRGIGQQILSDLAKKYDGSFRTNEKDGVYTATLILNAEENYAANRDL